MVSKIKYFFPVIFFLLCIVFFTSSTVKPAFADSVTLSGTVTDSASNGISGATVSVNDSNSDQTTTTSSGNYNLSIP